MAKVRKWKAFISTPSTYCDNLPCHGLAIFCRTICQFPPTHLEAVVPRLSANLYAAHSGAAEAPPSACAIEISSRSATLEIRDAKDCELPDYIHKTHFESESQLVSTLGIQKWLTRLVTENCQVEFLHCMNRCLVKYVRSFERSERLARKTGRDNFVNSRKFPGVALHQDVLIDELLIDTRSRNTYEKYLPESCHKTPKNSSKISLKY
jgi:hypothetical protein